ncbi:hypothetical protein [Neptunicella marina]|uniref:Uncharacterized protein n=1 Tax=Neptunicella marina TaxID=2125989 RepID=A0A8J6IU48_9ALTE|nr:hypothetical protein [Neptunicella marina]MBC3766726.1 hypothetical protein [Neptunicella marina]
MLLILISVLVSALYYYVQAFKYGLSARKWAIAGLLGGPMLFPIFNAKKRMALRRASGFRSTYFQA